MEHRQSSVRLPIPLLAAIVLGCAVADIAGANGINPPRLRGASVITASCVERSGQRQHDILRARITTAGGASDALTVRIGDASEQVPMAKIASVTLTAGTADKDGFVRGTVLRRAESTQEPAAVQVRSGTSAVVLSGFKESGSKISVEVAKCQRIEFSATADGPADYRDMPKK